MLQLSRIIIFLSTVQQLCIAYSTYVVLSLTISLTTNVSYDIISNGVFRFVSAIFIAYTSGLINHYFLRSRQNKIWYNYSINVYNNNVEFINIYKEIDKKNIHNFLISEAHEIIFEYISFKKDLYETSLNILLNVIVIYSTIGTAITIILAISFSLGLISYFYIIKMVKRFSKLIQKRRLFFYNKMSIHVDKIFSLPNFYRKKEKKHLQKVFTAFRFCDEIYPLLEAVPIFVMVASISIGLFIGFQFELLGSRAIVLGVLIAIPRLVQIMQYLNDIFSFITKYHYYKVRIKIIENFMIKNSSKFNNIVVNSIIYMMQ